MSENENCQEQDYLIESEEGAGVRELMELCKSIEEAYFEAVVGTTERNVIYASDSTS